ncbi:hypothetical protein TNCT6_72140 [Streptomyces sp. 6-11-2]|nr:hypothetical protein TNCT6_72140 [Streptomyces sp. 6-11-2]
MGGAGGVGAELGEDPPDLEVGEAVLDRCTSDGEDAAGILLAWGELVSAAGCGAGDDHGVTYVVVQAAEAEAGEGAETGCSRRRHHRRPPHTRGRALLPLLMGLLENGSGRSSVKAEVSDGKTPSAPGCPYRRD